MSTISGGHTMIKYPQRSLKCLEMNPILHILWMLLRANITMFETMITSTQDGPHYIKRGTKSC